MGSRSFSRDSRCSRIFFKGLESCGPEHNASEHEQKQPVALLLGNGTREDRAVYDEFCTNKESNSKLASESP